jgi:hypothetical protein
MYQAEIEGLLKDISIEDDGEHLWDNYQRVTAVTIRLSELHNEISYMEILGTDWPEIKKLRTLIIDPTIERLEKVAAFESRKITAKAMELEMERK